MSDEMDVGHPRRPSDDPARAVRVTAYTREASDERDDLVAVEAPLEVRVNGEPFAVIMRTPGDDRALALGFLFSENVVVARADVVAIDSWPGDAVLGNRVNVMLAEDASHALAALSGERRRVAMSSACGLCGRVSIESLARDATPIPVGWTVDARLVAGLPDRLRTVQTVFEGTGGLHAAALFDRAGDIKAAAEDVGRHNAVDKLVGAMLQADRLPLADTLLAVSGRASFELVQKACLAGIPLLVAVSAPSSLAIELAAACGMTLVGFARGERFNVYAHPERVQGLRPA